MWFCLLLLGKGGWVLWLNWIEVGLWGMVVDGWCKEVIVLDFLLRGVWYGWVSLECLLFSFMYVYEFVFE